jgi:hypothetical protein
MPVAELTSPLYAAGLRASIHPEKATPSDLLPGYLDRTSAPRLRISRSSTRKATPSAARRR